MELADVLSALACARNDVLAVTRVGSRVYGTATEASDHDFVAVLAEPDARRDLAFGSRLDVVVHGRETFERALAEQSVFALECHFAPRAHRLVEPARPFVWRRDLAKLRASASARSTAYFDKAIRRFEEDPAAAKKRIFHALRVPTFALEIARRGRLDDLTAVAPLCREIFAHDGGAAEHRAAFGPRRDALLEALAAACSSKR